MKNRRLPSVQQFITMLNEHTFSFIPFGDRSTPHAERQRIFIERQEKEMMFFEIAWAGGDAYMLYLLNAQSRAFYEQLNERLSEARDEAVRSADEVVSLRYFRTLDPEFQQYLKMLASHDWTYPYSDDVRAWRAGNDVEKKILDIVERKEGEYRKAYEAFRSQTSVK